MISSTCGFVLKHFKSAYLPSNTVLCSSWYREIVTPKHLPLAGTAYNLIYFSSNRNFCSITQNNVGPCDLLKYKQRQLVPVTACNIETRNLFNSVLTSNNNKVGRFFKKLFKRKAYADSTLSRSGYALYGEASMNTDVLNFIKVLSLEDTFFSWFLIMELQVWLLSVRLGAEGDYGKAVRDSLINALWQDVHAKIKEIGVRPTNKSRQIDELNSHFQTSLVSYDEGLLSCDRTLACAVWRNIIRREIGDKYNEDNPEDSSSDSKSSENKDKSSPDVASSVNLDSLIVKPTVDPRALEAVVCYIRKQMYLLDQVPTEELLGNGKVSWTKLEAIS